MTGPDLSIIVPVFDEQESIAELTHRIRSACGESGYTFEVLLVDDGSKDDSWNKIQSIHESDARFAGFRLRRNYGKSAALAVGFENASGRYVVTMDADLQDDPDEIPGMIEMLASGYDLVSGWKKKRRDPITKIIPSRFFNFVTGAITGIPLHDFNCGLKAYRREVLEHVHLYGELHRYIPALVKWEGYDRIGEKVVEHHARKYGRTKFGLERYLRGFLDLISVIFLTRFSARPMHFFGSMGTAAFIGGFIISLWLSVEKIFFGQPIGDRPLLLFGVLLILVGIQMFTVGLIGALIVVPRMQRASAYDVVSVLKTPSPVETSSHV